MTEHDLTEVVEIEEACGLSCWGWGGYHGELQAGQTSLMIVARPPVMQREWMRERIVGFIAARLTADELHINNVAVRLEHRRHGVGGALLAASLERGRQRGAQKAFLEVRGSNAVAQALYARYGFKVVGRRVKYYSDPVEDALIMAAHL